MSETAKTLQALAPETPGAPAPDREYKAAQALAAKALMLADTYHTPPVPKTFEVWYSYAAGHPEAVGRRINEIVEKDGSVAAYDLDQIHLEYLSMPERERKFQDTLSAHLDYRMDEIVHLVRSHIASSDAYSDTLKQAANSLTDNPQPDKIRSAIESLLQENARMRAETTKMGDALAKSRAQVRQLRASLERSRDKEMRDPMTNLPNRRLFDLRLPREIADAHQTGAPMCLALGDIDHFKTINDTYGHPVGDDVLRFFATVLDKNIKGRDLAARYGGEEFALILPGTKGDDGVHLLRQIMEQLSKTDLVIAKGKAPVGKMTVSFGIAQLRPDEDMESIVSRTDRKLYEAKRTGRNRIVCDW